MRFRRGWLAAGTGVVASVVIGLAVIYAVGMRADAAAGIER